MKETKNERFRRVAGPRVGKMLTAMKLLERCGNPLIYEYSEEEVNKLLGAIDERLRALHKAFAPRERAPRKMRERKAIEFSFE